MIPIAEQIREARKAAGLTQKRLAELIEIAPPHLCEYETGKHEPNASRFQEIIAACIESVSEQVAELERLGVGRNEASRLRRIRNALNRMAAKPPGPAPSTGAGTPRT